MKRILLAAAAALFLIHPASAQRANYEQMVASHAAANGVPVELVHRVIVRESRYNPRAVSKGNYGMMQIRLQTARGLGYTGNAQGLLDPETNLTYAVKYLAGAYRVANGNQNRAVSYYAGGYYYAAKRQGLTERQARAEPATPAISLFDANAQDVERPARRQRHHQ
ncbi:MAG: transglycosylase SLT domain-containing protein [Pseudomonadota bacterium]|jgi:soluble lytic murein transglycosylase-like protein